MEEQIYPVEKATADIQPVWTLSALQIQYLLFDSDPEAMFDAACGYLRTAEKLDAVADGIRRGSTDLAAGWRGAAAAESQQQLRQFYGSARSLAAAARCSAAALNHAAQALTAARNLVTMLPGGILPSPDPQSLQSWSYQRLLADLNAAYRDATAMAPDQIAVCLPEQQDRTVRESVPEWDDFSGDGSNLIVAAGRGGETGQGSLRPVLLAPVIPANPRISPNSAGRTDGVSGHGVIPSWSSSGDHQSGDRQSSTTYEDIRGDTYGDAHEDPYRDAYGRSPYSVGSSLAGGGGLGGIPGGPMGLGGSARQSGDALGRLEQDGQDPRASGGRLGIGTGAEKLANQSSVYPACQSQREGERDRERRYYLKEERDVWGELEATPAVLYGECRPPQVVDDEDDDF